MQKTTPLPHLLISVNQGASSAKQATQHKPSELLRQMRTFESIQRHKFTQIFSFRRFLTPAQHWDLSTLVEKAHTHKNQSTTNFLKEVAVCSPNSQRSSSQSISLPANTYKNRAQPADLAKSLKTNNTHLKHTHWELRQRSETHEHVKKLSFAHKLL